MIHTILITLTAMTTWLFLKIGYWGVLVLMTIASTFIPLPSEIILAPAGFMVAQHHMNFWIVLLMAMCGSMIGSYINYYLGATLGREFLLRYGKFFGFSQKKFQWMERVFLEYGAISTLIGRVIPLVRNYISIPAGIVKMNPVTFFIYTFIGSLAWVLFLVTIGFYVGNNMLLVSDYVHRFLPYLIGGALLILGVYLVWHHYQKRGKCEK